MRQLYEVQYTLYHGEFGNSTHTVHVAADEGTSLDAILVSAEAYMDNRYGTGVKKSYRSKYRFKLIAPTNPLVDVQHDTIAPLSA